jgi:cold shock protein
LGRIPRIEHLGCLKIRDSPAIAGEIKSAVKWFDPMKGYGFIKPERGGREVFVHISAVEKAGHASLSEGSNVRYELLTTRSGKTAAAAAFAYPNY